MAGSPVWWARFTSSRSAHGLTEFAQSDPKIIKEIINAVTIPGRHSFSLTHILIAYRSRLTVMAKARIGHFVEAQVGHKQGASIPSILIACTALDPASRRLRLH
jgi:pyridoxal biosynthesis lyase PdxS